MISSTFEIRIKIDDILNLGEEDIMESFFEIMKKIHSRKAIFWHNEITEIMVKNFVDRWKTILEENGVLFKIQDINTINTYVWFDILNERDNRKEFKHRFKCISNNKTELIRALFSYYNTVNFVNESYGKKIKYVKEIDK